MSLTRLVPLGVIGNIKKPVSLFDMIEGAGFFLFYREVRPEKRVVFCVDRSAMKLLLYRSWYTIFPPQMV